MCFCVKIDAPRLEPMENRSMNGDKTIASDLLQRHFQTLVNDNLRWQMLIDDQYCMGTRLRGGHRPPN